MELLLFNYEIDCVEVSGKRYIRKGVVIGRDLPEATKVVSELYGEDNIFEIKLVYIGGVEEKIAFETENIEI